MHTDTIKERKKASCMLFFLLHGSAGAAEDVHLGEFMHLVFSRMPGESYRRRLRSLLCLCDVF